MTKPELLEAMRAGQTRLDSALSAFTDAQMVTPGMDGEWSVKDLIAHLSAWERRATTLLKILQRGEIPPAAGPEDGLDALNARFYSENKDRSLTEVLAAKLQSFDDFLALVEASPDDDLFSPTRFAWTEGRPFESWVVGNTYDHYDEHLVMLKTWAEQLNQL